MKTSLSRLFFYAGFVVGTCTLHVFLRQVRFDKTLSNPVATSSHDEHHQLQEESEIWKKERSALFNLKHPHHKGKPQVDSSTWCFCGLWGKTAEHDSINFLLPDLLSSVLSYFVNYCSKLQML